MAKGLGHETGPKRAPPSPGPFGGRLRRQIALLRPKIRPKSRLRKLYYSRGSIIGSYLEAVWPESFGPVLGRFLANPVPKTFQEPRTFPIECLLDDLEQGGRRSARKRHVSSLCNGKDALGMRLVQSSKAALSSEWIVEQSIGEWHMLPRPTPLSGTQTHVQPALRRAVLHNMQASPLRANIISSTFWLVNKFLHKSSTFQKPKF